MRTTESTLLSETVKIPLPTMTEPINDGLVVVDDGLIENPIAAPEVIARVRASLHAMKITRMRRSRLDAQ